VRSRRKKKKRPFEKRGGTGNPGLGRVLGWLGAEKVNPRTLKGEGCGIRLKLQNFYDLEMREAAGAAGRGGVSALWFAVGRSPKRS